MKTLTRNMKSLIFVVWLMICFPMIVSAQESAAKRAFTAGDYLSAAQLYQAAIASTEDSALRESLSKELSQAQRCGVLIDRAEAAFHRGAYAEARKNYQILLAQNAADPRAEKQIARCNQLLKEASDRAAERARHDKAYAKAIESWEITDVLQFVNKYPNDEKTPLLRAYVEFQTGKKSIPRSEEEVTLFKSLGDLMLQSDKQQLARQIYEFAMLTGDPEAMVKKASTYRVSEIDKILPLLVIAEAAGYEPAVERLAQLRKEQSLNFNRYGYDKQVAQRYYVHLTKYRTELQSCIYVLANLADLPIENTDAFKQQLIHLLSHLPYHEESVSANQLYYAAINFKNELGPRASIFIEQAALKGNLSAVNWMKEHKTGDEAAAWKFYYDYTDKAKDYLKFIQGSLSIDWASVMIYLQTVKRQPYYNIHEYLYAYVQCASAGRGTFLVKGLSRFLKDYSSQIWDTGLIQQCRMVATHSVHAKKITKLLDKVKTAPDQYDPHRLYCQQVQNLNFGLRHTYTSPKETLITIKSHTATTSTSTSRTATPSYSRGTTSRNSYTSTTSAKRSYYVGQDLGVGYVFWVNSEGTHGLIVSKQYVRCKPKDRYNSITRSAKYKWRIPKTNELFIVYEKLKDKYPVAGFLAQNSKSSSSLSLKCVNFGKKHAYMAEINESYTYHLLTVAEF